ncbi:MAG: energy transducer TonB, partial [Nannocystaceae bacterium]
SNAGLGRTYGAEVLLRKSLTRNFYAWLSYTLSRGELRDVPGADFNVVDFDQTHILTLIGSYKFPRNWQLGARFRLVSGNPTTPIVNGAFDSETGAYRCIEGPRNSDRIKTFHQLDLRVDKRWYAKRAEISLYLDIQNAYNRRNVEFRNYAFNCQSFQPVTGLPIIPSIGTRIEF